MEIFYRETGEVWESIVGSLIRKIFIQHTRSTLKSILSVITTTTLIIGSTLVLMLSTHKMPTRHITTPLENGVIPDFLLDKIMARQVHHLMG